MYNISVEGKISHEEQLEQIDSAFGEVSKASDAVLIEGTGHCAVGSIVNVNNALVAHRLGASMLLIANGGLGAYVFFLLIFALPILCTLCDVVLLIFMDSCIRIQDLLSMSWVSQVT